MQVIRTLRVVSAMLAAIACGSNKKQSEPQPSETKQAETKQAETRQAEAKQTETAGSRDPWAAQGSSVSQDELLKADMDVICGAAKATGKEWFNDVGPYIAENMKSLYKYELFEGVTTGQASLDDLVARIRRLMTKTGVTKCDTVDVLLSARARSKQ